MSLLIGFLTFILVVVCVFLILLVLVQLPKKEAGAGLAFGAGAVDTLIGAGSGNALTKMTKYVAGVFLGLAVLLAVLNAQRHQSTSRTLQQELARKSAAAPMLPTQPAATPNNSAVGNRATQPAVTPGATSAPASGQLQTLQLGQTPAINPTPTPAGANNGAAQTQPAPANNATQPQTVPANPGNTPAPQK